jgi:hypothetical protein
VFARPRDLRLAVPRQPSKDEAGGPAPCAACSPQAQLRGTTWRRLDPMREWGLTDEECDERRRRILELGLGRHLPSGFHGPRWSREQLALLGTEADDVVARKVGRTAGAVRQKREELGIPNPAPLSTRGNPDWTAAEDELASRLSAAEVARRTGRTVGAVYSRRNLLRQKAGRAQTRGCAFTGRG